MIRNRHIVVTVMAAVLLLFLASCDDRGIILHHDGNPSGKTNLMPLGSYTGEAGTLTFDIDSPVSPSGDSGLVFIQLAPDYIYLLGGRENNTTYEFLLDKGDNGSDLWRFQIYSYWDSEYSGNGQKVFNFVWNRAGWDTGEDEVIIKARTR